MKNKEAQQPTLYKSNSGRSGKIKVCAFNKLWWWRKGNRLEIRYCSYTGPLVAMAGRPTSHRQTITTKKDFNFNIFDKWLF